MRCDICFGPTETPVCKNCRKTQPATFVSATGKLEYDVGPTMTKLRALFEETKDVEFVATTLNGESKITMTYKVPERTLMELVSRLFAAEYNVYIKRPVW